MSSKDEANDQESLYLTKAISAEISDEEIDASDGKGSVSPHISIASRKSTVSFTMGTLYHTDHIPEPTLRKQLALEASLSLLKACLLRPVAPDSSLYLGGGLLDPISLIEVINKQHQTRKQTDPKPSQDIVLKRSSQNPTFFRDLHYAWTHSYAAYSVVAKAGKLDDLYSTIFLHTIQPLIDDLRDCSDVEENLKAVCQLSGLTIENIKSSNWKASTFRPCYYLALDPKNNCIVLSIRGTTHEGDILTDVCADVMPLFPDHPSDAEESSYFEGGIQDEIAHKGMLHSALHLVDELWPQIKELLKANPRYNIFVTGHSLGGGVAALVSVLLMETPKRKYLEGRLKCITFGSPSIMSHNLSTICSKYTTCVVAGKDVVPRLSMVSLTRLLKELNESSPLRRGIRYLETSIGQMKTKIEQSMKSIQLPLQSYPSTQIERERSAYETHTSAVKHSPEAQNPLKSWFEQALPFLKPQGDTSNPATHSPKDHPLETEQDHIQAGNESKQMMDSGEGLDDPEALENNTIIPELYPPGEILQVYRPNSSQLIIVTSKPEAYQEIQLSSTMLSDHMPSIYSHLCSALLERSLEHPFVTKRKS